MKDLIKIVAKEFNQQEIIWGIGGSYLLQRYGIKTEVNDIDILVSLDSIQKVIQIMNKIAIKQETIDENYFNSNFYSVYKLEGININIVSNLSYNHKEDFQYNFDQEDINVYENHGDYRINYCHLMDWYIIYKEINENSISKSIETYYKDGGFVDDGRFYKKFGISNLNLLHENYNNLRTLI